jgi:replication-associated recombination protein RarA
MRLSRNAGEFMREFPPSPFPSVSFRPGNAMQQPLEALDQLIGQVSEVILGKDTAIRQCVTCLLAGGHLLIEDLPGVGKTTLAHALAISLGLRRSQPRNA